MNIEFTMTIFYIFFNKGMKDSNLYIGSNNFTTTNFLKKIQKGMKDSIFNIRHEIILQWTTFLFFLETKRNEIFYFLQWHDIVFPHS